MGLENLNRWHWAIIGLLVGALFGGTRVFWRDGDPGGERTFDRAQFEEVIYRRTDVRNLVLHPPIDGQEWLTGEMYKRDNDRYGPRLRRQPAASTQPAQENPGHWVKFPMLAAEADSRRLEYKAPNPVTGAEYLASLEKKFPRLKTPGYLASKFAWWEQPKYTVGIYAAAGLVLIGGVWATIVNLLTGAGFGPAKKVKETYNLDRFNPEAAPAMEAATVNDGQSQLAVLNAKLEENVADMFIAGDKSALQEEDEEEAAAIKQLQMQSMDATEVTTAEQQESKEYKGEFYPVVKPITKRED